MCQTRSLYGLLILEGRFSFQPSRLSESTQPWRGLPHSRIIRLVAVQNAAEPGAAADGGRDLGFSDFTVSQRGRRC
jgi:hypothetical protein